MLPALQHTSPDLQSAVARHASPDSLPQPDDTSASVSAIPTNENDERAMRSLLRGA